MIKIYCDKCGKEITDSVYKEIEETKVIAVDSTVIAKWQTELHYCDECTQYNLTCGFKVGDKVFTDDGRVGKIESICDCERCKNRGFYEPKVKMDVGNDQIWITDTDKENGFISFYQIGDKVFGNIDEKAAERIQERMIEVGKELRELRAQSDMLSVLKKCKNNNTK